MYSVLRSGHRTDRCSALGFSSYTVITLLFTTSEGGAGIGGLPELRQIMDMLHNVGHPIQPQV